ncbi:hypothetical protein [Nonomuraea sp. NPDC050691]|uniref:cell division protein ZapB n=1 Tax=Nonomuraea sp. NPDC050691 TaxID=3155661 RepID=UPI00340F4CE9
MTRPGLPDADTVRAAMDTVLATAAERGRRPTVTAVERHLGIAHATFHRHYNDLITGYFHPRLPAADTATTAATPATPATGPDERDRAAVQRLRRENADLRRTVETYAEMIRQLAVENEALRRAPSTVRPLTARGMTGV